jgi:hypothetical protein
MPPFEWRSSSARETTFENAGNTIGQVDAYECDHYDYDSYGRDRHRDASGSAS